MTEKKKILFKVENLQKYFPIKKTSVFQREQKFVRANKDISIDEEITIHAKWKLKEYCLPDFLLPYGQELINLFNENVRYGCCGGCI